MGLLDVIRSTNGGTAAQIAELERRVRSADAMVDVMQESLADLEREAFGWRRVAPTSESTRFSRSALDSIVDMARVMYLKNPLIRRGVNVKAHYVFGQGVQVRAAGDDRANDVIQEWWRNNRSEFGHQARTGADRTLTTEGNRFYGLFTNASTGGVLVRSVPYDEIRGAITDPDDRTRVLYWRRSWSSERLDVNTGNVDLGGGEAYHPDWSNLDGPGGDGHPERIQGVEVIEDVPIYHVRVGEVSGMTFGVPEVYPALSWAIAYKDFLEDWSSLVNSLQRFAYKLTTRPQDVQAAADKLETSVSDTDRAEDNPAPVTGSVFVGDEDVDLTPIPKTGATIDADDARNLRLMVASALGLPDTILSGDVDVGNFATSKTLDRPTELAMRDRQMVWAEVIRDLATFAVAESRGAPSGALRDVREDVQIDVDFPPILEHDLAEQVSAIVEAATLDGDAMANVIPQELTTRLLLTALGVEDVDAELDRMFDGEGNEAVRRFRHRVARALSEQIPDADDPEVTVTNPHERAERFAPEFGTVALTEFDRQREDVERLLGSARGPEDVRRQIEALPPEWRERARRAVADVAARALVAAAEATAEAEGVDIAAGSAFGLDSEDVQQAVRRESFAFADAVTDTSADRVREVLEESIEENRTVRATRQALREEFRTWDEVRAARVARTETIRASNRGAKVAYRRAGVTNLRWLAASDACPYCSSLNGTVVGIDRNFLNVGEDFQPDGTTSPYRVRYLDVDTPPLHPNCRCSIVAT